MRVGASASGDAAGEAVFRFGPFPERWLLSGICIHLFAQGVFTLEVGRKTPWESVALTAFLGPTAFTFPIWERMDDAGFIVVRCTGIGAANPIAVFLEVRAA